MISRDFVYQHAVDLIHSQIDETIPVVINNTSPLNKHCPEDPFSEFRSCKL